MGIDLLTRLEIAFENPFLFDLAGHVLGEIGEEGETRLLGLGALLREVEIGDLGGHDLDEGLVLGGIHDLVQLGAQPVNAAARVLGSDDALPDATGSVENGGHRGVDLGPVVGMESFEPVGAGLFSASEEMPSDRSGRRLA